MEGLRGRRVPIGAALIALALAPVAQAQEAEQKLPPYKHTPSVVVYTRPDAAVVEADAHTSVPGVAPGRVRGRRQCQLQPQGNVGAGSAALWAEHLDEALFSLYCNGQFVTMVWRKIDLAASPSGRSLPPRQVAMHLREEIPVPEANVGANPGIGLVGMESWFWIEGYSGDPIADATDAFGQRVEVEARVERYDWSFGDGSSLASSSTGLAYPARSEVRHTYQRSKLAGGAYPVEVRFVFSVRYRMGGGEWLGLPGISRRVTFAYRVQESQAVISR
ncbi:MAG: hypothetical protein ACRDJ4_00935 [Actinomycetota bacterium]